MKTFLRECYYWIPVVLFMGIIFAFSSLPAIQTTPTYWTEFTFKKTIHFFEYATLWTLLFRAFTNSSTLKIDRRYTGILSLCLAALYGISDELHQTLIPTREGTLRDAVIDALGASSAYVFVYVYLSKAPAKLQKFFAWFDIT